VKLVLFDIDGTLLLSDGAGRRAIHRALIDVFGATGPTDYWFDGKTDPQIVRDLMRLAGHTDDRIDREMDALLSRYVNYLLEELHAPGYDPRPLPGVPALLDALEARADVALGLLTGNIEPGARAKLEAVGINPARFRVGAFGSDHAHRPELPAIARERLRERLGVQVPGDRVFVIGDTPADLTCGNAIGANAIGVATGRFSVAQLSEFRPSAVFENLADTAAVLRSIVGE
jgi:phosphoglycolate phosphatase-like HAD superfamily hydrolase